MSHASTSRLRPRGIRFGAEIGALGVVFGDIGTSPLYAFRQGLLALGNDGLVPDEIIGVLSLMIWSMILVVTVKYVIFVLRADNDGEGGILALVTLLDLHRSAKRSRRVLLVCGLFGAAMLFGDGMLTPAVSVLSAIEGLEVIAPQLHSFIVPLTLVILLVLFLSQRAGTDRIAGIFGPIMLLWFGSIGAFGVLAVIESPQVLWAFDPRPGVAMLLAEPAFAGLVLGAIFLTVTGGEALYADLGHFGRGVISRAWLVVAMPGLMLNYLGQGAAVLRTPGAMANPFYAVIPDAFDPAMVVLATLATVIASQAIITGVFSLAKQAVELGYLPPMRIRHTSAHNLRHIVIPRVNAILMIGTLAIVAGFRTSEALASAYGIAVAATMVTTTILLIAWMRKRAYRPVLIVTVGVPFLILDLAFFIANLTKLHDGGWLPLTVGALVLVVMAAWRRGLDDVVAQQLRYSMPLDVFLDRNAPAAQLPRTAIFLSRSGAMTPVALVRLRELAGITFERIVIVSVWVAARPRVPIADRVRLVQLGTQVTRVDLRFGYMQDVNVPSVLVPALRGISIDVDEAIWVIGHERVVPPESIGGVRDFLAHVFALLARTAERSVDRFELPRRRTLEVGYAVKL